MEKKNQRKNDKGNDQMLIRLLTNTDAPSHEKVASQAFNYSVNPYEETELPCELMLGAFDDDGALMADMEIYDRQCIMNGEKYNCAHIEGVACKPEHRGKGAVKALFAAIADKSIFGDRFDVGFLHPFSVEYYSKLGYDPFGKIFSVSMPFSSISGIKRTCDFTIYEGNEAEELNALFNSRINDFDFSFIRKDGEEYSDKPYYSMQYTYFHRNQEGKIDSFLTLSQNRDTSTVSVKEIVAENEEGIKLALGFLRNFEGNYTELVIDNVPENSVLFNIIGNEKIKKIEKSIGSIKMI